MADETRAAVTNSLGITDEDVAPAIRQGKDPTSKALLAEFLATKGSKLARYPGFDALNCGNAIVDLIRSVTDAAKAARIGAVPLITLL